MSDSEERTLHKALRASVEVIPPYQWTTEPPTEPGWYWVESRSLGRIIEFLNPPIWRVRATNTSRWAGPIPEPGEE